ncbi:DUF1566 domain-containing protein [Candidatus Woesearchaeota archaeon]|nr:DUF1566 domain-containing protein [Candidatus Woesearchaeota archaeon]
MKKKSILGWITSVICIIIISVWSYWGIGEAFHEGWFHISLWQNLSLTFIQYLSVPIIFLVVSLIAMNFRRLGAGLFLALSIFSIFFFDSPSGRFLIFIPLLLFALGFYFGEFKYKKIIAISFVVIFLLIILSIGIPQFIKVENRFNDNNFGLRIIKGNDVTLNWAAEGVGFPLHGTDWQTAKNNCEQLEGDWRLPTREEIVRSMTRKNKNAGGSIVNGIAQYEIRPDKETPLWNPNSQVIYYWTSESKNEQRAYLVAYNGYILDRSKTSAPNYQGYRCVKDI